MVKTETASTPTKVSVSRRRREREVAETRQKILDAAREMFVEAGYDATTMRAIANRIDYTPTAIYHHFDGKHALLTELCATDLRVLAAAFGRIAHIEDPVERLRKGGETYVRFALEHPMQYQLIFMTRHPTVEAGYRRGDPAEDAYGFIRQTCADCIASGRLRPEFDDPDELAQIAWASLHGILALHLVREGRDEIDWRDPQETASRACDTLIRGLLREPQP
jgi:AcrR family transcriptional regulator